MNKLSEDSEIVAMRSFGLDKFQLFKPLLIFGIIMSIFVFAVGQKIVPYSQKRFRNQLIKLTSKGVLTDIKAGHFFTDIPEVTLFAKDVFKKGEILGDVFIHAIDKKKFMERIIFAKKGILTKTKVGEWEIPDLRMHLSDGNIIQRYLGKKNVEKILFKDYEFPLFNENSAPGLIKKDSMRSFSELIEIIFNKEKRNADIESVRRAELEFWTRINTPILILLFIFLGFNLGIKKGRGRSRNTSSLAFAILVLYYALFFLGVSIGQKGQINTAFAVLFPTFLLLVINTYFYKRMDWMS
jgi:lipopolysaccharide export system permease protein